MASKFTSSGVSFTNSSGHLVSYQAPNFTNPSGTVIVLSCLASNAFANTNVQLISSINQGSTEVSKIVNNIVIPSGSALELIPNKLVLTSGQSIRSTIYPSGNASTTVSVLEIY